MDAVVAHLFVLQGRVCYASIFFTHIVDTGPGRVISRMSKDVLAAGGGIAPL
jgi:hypothetical protein